MFLRSITQTLARRAPTTALATSQQARLVSSTSSSASATSAAAVATSSAASPGLLTNLVADAVLQEEHKDVLRSCEQSYEEESLRMTWVELKRYADALSCGLHDGRVRPSHRMAIQLGNDAETLFSFLACAQLGVESVFLPPTASVAAQLAYQQQQAGVDTPAEEPSHIVPANLDCYQVLPSPVEPDLRLECQSALEQAKLRGVIVAPQHVTMWRKIIPDLALAVREGVPVRSPQHPQFKVPIQSGFEYERRTYWCCLFYSVM
jgi:AMP-binding enzyme